MSSNILTSLLVNFRENSTFPYRAASRGFPMQTTGTLANFLPNVLKLLLQCSATNTSCTVRTQTRCDNIFSVTLKILSRSRSSLLKSTSASSITRWQSRLRITELFFIRSKRIDGVVIRISTRSWKINKVHKYLKR